jgi:outer membrane lipoprotein-sorting protein
VVNRFLRTAPTRRLVAVAAGVVVAIAAGTTIAIAAQGSGPVPAPKPLATAIHQALTAPSLAGVSGRISFTDNLIPGSDIQGSDPLLGGGSGRFWVSPGHGLRLEIQGTNGDANVVVSHGSFWAYDPSSNTVYEGTLPRAGGAATHKHAADHGGVPSIAEIQSYLNRAMAHLTVSRATPGDIAGQPTYTLSVSPKRSGGLLGAAQLAWDAVRGVPLRFALYARGDSTPVISLQVTNISFAAVPSSVFDITPPAGASVVNVGTLSAAHRTSKASAAARHERDVTGLRAVAAHVPFALAAPATAAHMARQSVSLLHLGKSSGALITYGEGLGGVVVIEQPAKAGAPQLSTATSDGHSGLSVPTVNVNGVTAQQLATPLGTVVRFQRSGVQYTVLGSVRARVADAVARAL